MTLRLKCSVTMNLHLLAQLGQCAFSIGINAPDTPSSERELSTRRKGGHFRLLPVLMLSGKLTIRITAVGPLILGLDPPWSSSTTMAPHPTRCGPRGCHWWAQVVLGVLDPASVASVVGSPPAALGISWASETAHAGETLRWADGHSGTIHLVQNLFSPMIRRRGLTGPVLTIWSAWINP